MANVKTFLNPESIVIVGVSRSKNKIGRLIYDQLLSTKRVVYGVNPSANRLDGEKIYHQLRDLPNPVELAIYAIPAQITVQAVKEAIQLGIKNHLIVASGFGESDEEGKGRERELKELLTTYNNITIQGPNCLGNISPYHHFNASFGYCASVGNIGFVSQSGAMGTAFLDWIAKRNLGISHFISLGNKINLNENDFLEFLAKDDKTKVIGLYLENIANGSRFLELTKQISQIKPLVIIKAGQTKEAKIAVTSHTGVLAGVFSSQRAAFRQANLIEANSMEDFFTLIEIASRYASNLTISNPIVISNAGGPAVLLVDKYAESNLKLAQLSNQTKNLLKMVLPAASSVHNPIDILGDADDKRLARVLTVIKKQNPQSFIQIVLTPQENTDLLAISRVIVKMAKDFSGKLVVSMIGGEKPEDAVELLSKNKIISVEFPENIPHYLAKITSFMQKKNHLDTKQMVRIKISSAQKRVLEKNINANIDKGFLSDDLAIKLAQAYQFPLVQSKVITNHHQTIVTAEKFGYPLALKVSSPLITHRNAVNGVKLNLKNQQELNHAYDVLHKLSDKLLLQKMIVHDIEAIVGAKKDTDFSYLLLFGSGGIHTDYLSDVNFGVVPLSYGDMEEIINGTKIAKLIKNKSRFWPIFTSLVSLLTDFPQIQEVDINPIIVLKDKLICVDFKVKL